MAQINQTSFDSIKEKIQAAEIAPLQTDRDTETDGNPGPLGPLEIAEGILTGSIPPEKVDELLLDWLAEAVDVPYVPEQLERKALSFVVEALEGVVLQLLRQQIR